MRMKMKPRGGEGEGVKQRVEAVRRSAQVRIDFVTYNDNDPSQTRSPSSFTTETRRTRPVVKGKLYVKVKESN